MSVGLPSTKCLEQIHLGHLAEDGLADANFWARSARPHKCTHLYFSWSCKRSGILKKNIFHVFTIFVPWIGVALPPTTVLCRHACCRILSPKVVSWGAESSLSPLFLARDIDSSRRCAMDMVVGHSFHRVPSQSVTFPNVQNGKFVIFISRE